MSVGYTDPSVAPPLDLARFSALSNQTHFVATSQPITAFELECYSGETNVADLLHVIMADGAGSRKTATNAVHRASGSRRDVTARPYAHAIPVPVAPRATYKPEDLKRPSQACASAPFALTLTAQSTNATNLYSAFPALRVWSALRPDAISQR
ncbi:hypothetical protein BN2475_1040002 [Paraburkholderia ribeironis]|uniref:Uncharacterized protein n=1 Tax=Paraburkholderia ribeironis TaxID=1247936 RepID=A0A1N7SM79_9BURK|nr:hypothetical protein BN2475_1040002 [Paraburkholderia ribeironis]